MMDREVFKEKFREEMFNPSYNDKKIREIIDKFVRYTDANNGNISTIYNADNLIIVQEELFELGKEISKIISGNINYIGLIENMADNYLGIMYLQRLFHISNEELQAAMMVKMNKLEDEINNGEYK